MVTSRRASGLGGNHVHLRREFDSCDDHKLYCMLASAGKSVRKLLIVRVSKIQPLVDEL